MIEEMQINDETLTRVLSKLLDARIIRADYQTRQLHGGTLGDVRLVTGMARTADGEELPYSVVLKTQKKWERYGDPHSWRREYDLCMSELGATFSASFRQPGCYHAEISEEENETQIWMEYIDGVSGKALTVEMLEQAALELGRWQGRLYAERPIFLRKLTNLGRTEDLKNYYLHYRSWNLVYDYIRSGNCEIPRYLREMLIEVDDNADEIWNRIEKLPIVLCHRDFWVANIFHSNGKIILIDWDTTGWGYLGEDIKSLVADEADVDHMVECYRKCVPAYYRGFSEYADVSHIADHCVREMILVNLGYRLVENYLYAESPDEKTLQVNTLQKIYEMGDL
jgi:tRNA A-37 threonylcarbamoyl transferase component Bud32